VDSSDVRRLHDCRKELEGLLKEEKLAGAALLVLANKQDLPGALPPESIEKELNLASLVGRSYCIIGCSAVTGSGLLDGFDWIVRDIRSRIFLLD